MDIWDSAVAMLDARGIIDKNEVGIIGFSRTGWYTEFILSHSATHYRAATVADNVEYSLGEYWLRHDPATIKAWDAMYGGPPYGKTLSNWIKYSISFDLDQIHTPILMEEMGDNQPAFTDPLAPPRLLAETFELFTGLNRLHRPVELYFYPNEDHLPDHPLARLSTLQRNLDWYRFWLQGHENPAADDPDRYARWRGLVKLQNENEKNAGIASPLSGAPK
jgi:dipeptidyl aminopeptidase/acylaminoacyl peptidase